MKRVHPNLSRAAIGATIALSMAVGGCRSTSGGNAFLAPDRVPPPSTRALLPGQAQPYYQGDPLPAMQSAANPPTNAVAASQSDAVARSSSGRTLAWTPPGSAPPAATSAPPPGPVAYTNEASVAVPTDADPLRFALPVPRETENATPIAAAAPPPSSQPVQPSAAQPPPGVLLASYNAPVASVPPNLANVPPIAAPQQVASPWRSPQLAQPTPLPYGAPLPAPPISPAVQPQVAIPANTMAVTLRAVASPPPQPGDPMPRVRVPGYIAPPQVSTADGFRPRTSMQ